MTRPLYFLFLLLILMGACTNPNNPENTYILEKHEFGSKSPSILDSTTAKYRRKVDSLLMDHLINKKELSATDRIRVDFLLESQELTRSEKAKLLKMSSSESDGEGSGKRVRE